MGRRHVVRLAMVALLPVLLVHRCIRAVAEFDYPAYYRMLSSGDFPA